MFLSSGFSLKNFVCNANKKENKINFSSGIAVMTVF